MATDRIKFTPHEKPDKPYTGFPLYAHSSGQWAKKIRGKLYYFGTWADPDGALLRLNREFPYLKDGRTPPPDLQEEGCPLERLCGEYMETKTQLLEGGERSAATWKDAHKTCRRLLDFFGKDRRVDDLQPRDFQQYRAALVKRGIGPVSLRNEINRTRAVFRFAKRNCLITNEVNFGTMFDMPSKLQIRRDRNAAGEKMFEAEEIHRILAECKNPQLKAMVLLGVNCGFGNTDCATLPKATVDLDGGWLEFPRPKTQIKRRVPLWPETVAALRVALESRPMANEPEDRGLYFITKYGRRWVRDNIKYVEKDGKQVMRISPIDSVTQEFSKILKALHINGRRGLGFYSLRHTFETIGGECRDQVAVDAIMGHVDQSMAGNYRHRISDERLRAVVDTIRDWLFGVDYSQGKEGGNQ